MTFAWPWLLLSLRRDPAALDGLPATAPAPRRAPGAARRPRSRPAGSAAGRRAARGSGPLPRRAGPAVRRAGPASGDDRRASASGHGGPCVRRLQQHGRHGRQADPDGGGQGGSPRVRRRSNRQRSGSRSWRSDRAASSRGNPPTTTRPCSPPSTGSRLRAEPPSGADPDLAQRHRRADRAARRGRASPRRRRARPSATTDQRP